jgi:hypothetical protein
MMRANRASTDAEGALHQWEHGALGRTYSIEDDQDDYLEARLEWSASERTAGEDLNSASAHLGVERTYFEQATVMKVGQHNGLVVVRCDDRSFATAKLMHQPDPQAGDVLTWTDRGDANKGRTMFTRKSDGPRVARRTGPIRCTRINRAQYRALNDTDLRAPHPLK